MNYLRLEAKRLYDLCAMHTLTLGVPWEELGLDQAGWVDAVRDFTQGRDHLVYEILGSLCFAETSGDVGVVIVDTMLKLGHEDAPDNPEDYIDWIEASRG